MFIGELAARTGLSVDTLRYYEKIGLIAPALRDRGGRRVYDAAVVGWIAFLARLKATGMGIADRLRYARLRREGDRTSADRRQMLERHRTRVRAEIATLTECLAILDDKIETYHAIEAGLAADRPTGVPSHDTYAPESDQSRPRKGPRPDRRPQPDAGAGPRRQL